jgi:hypothetical protein
VLANAEASPDVLLKSLNGHGSTFPVPSQGTHFVFTVPSPT